MLIPNKHINNCKTTRNEKFKWSAAKKKKKICKFSLASGWKNACQAKNSLTASLLPVTSIHDTFYVGCGLCFLDATSASEATVTWCIMRIIFRCICGLPCLEARVTTCQKRDPPLLFSPLECPLVFLWLLSEDHPVILAWNDWWRSRVAWIFVYFLINSMEFFLKVSQEYKNIIATVSTISRETKM